MIDLNAIWGEWPIQRIPRTSLAQLDAVYELLGVTSVWLSAMESILAPEPDRADEALFQQLADHSRFQPVKTINPLLANWQLSLARTLACHPLAAVKLFPSYHGYTLDHPEVRELCQLCAERKLPMLVQTRVNDERTQPIALEIPPVPVAGIAALSQQHPHTIMVALSTTLHELEPLSKGGEKLLVDISFLDAIAVLERALAYLPLQRIVFGTASTWLVPHASALKMTFSKLPQDAIEAIGSHNIQRLRCANE